MDNPFTHINFLSLAAFLLISIVMPIAASVVLPVVLVKKQKRPWAFFVSLANTGGSIAMFILTAGLAFVQATSLYEMNPVASYFSSLLLVGAVVTFLFAIVLTVVTGVLWLKE